MKYIRIFFRLLTVGITVFAGIAGKKGKYTFSFDFSKKKTVSEA